MHLGSQDVRAHEKLVQCIAYVDSAIGARPGVEHRDEGSSGLADGARGHVEPRNLLAIEVNDDAVVLHEIEMQAAVKGRGCHSENLAKISRGWRSIAAEQR